MKHTTEHFLGRDSSGTRIYVEINKQVIGSSVRRMTVEHAVASSSIDRVSITGVAIDKGRRNWSACGQIVGELKRIVEPAPGWTLKDIRALVTFWDEWHLNDMQADCAHGKNCPTGYRSGSAWLVKPLTRTAAAQLGRFQSMKTTKIPGE